jgi:gliding motility-associated-like protein
MKNILRMALFIPALVSASSGYGQSDGCSAATAIPVTANCSSPVAGTTTGATQTISGCVGTADDDVWYTFTATAANHIITVSPSASFDPVVQLFSGPCSALISLKCMDNGLTGDDEIIYATGLTPGNVYTVRVYHYYTGSGSGDFTICVTEAPPAPANDNCSSATLLNVNSSCTPTAGTTVSASQSQAGCAGTADDDVWYKFVATNAVQTIQVTPLGYMDPVVELFSGSCAALSSITCRDSGFWSDTETIQAVGLIPGTTYYVRVYDYYSGNGGGDFNICIIGTPTAAPTNDEPCNAIALPPVTSACDYISFTTTGATTSLGAPTPASCVGGSAPAQGGFNNTPQPKDVWFSITVPSSGVISIMARPAYGFTDAVMALYSGTCSSLTQIACSDDHNYPGSSNDMRPFILASGLTPGSTVFLRYWAFSGNTTGDFGLCVSTPTNDACSNALYICDLNGYEGTTNAAYTIDRPSNMRGNAEMNNPPTYTYTPGTCQGGVFGLGGAWGTGAPNCDVQINNNSWIRFTAAADSAVLDVDIYDCYVGSYPSGGIQMQVFSAASPCTTFAPVSDFKEGSSHLTITARGLSMGEDYYLMIDGFAGDICGYSISASSGVQFPDITAANDPICSGASTTLYGPAGASAYHWYPGNQTTQNIVVNPATTMSYSLEVTGVCGHRQYLDYTLDVNQLPTAAASSNTPVCAGSTISFTGSGGISYSWSGPGFSSSATNPSIAGATTANTGTYSLTVTDANGCSNTTTTSVVVNSNPSANAGTNQTIPFGTNTTLAGSATGGSGSYSYSWSPAGSLVSSNIANPQTVNLTTSTVFTLTVTDASTGCISTSQMTVIISGGPLTADASALGAGVCIGGGVELSVLASGGSSPYTYTWTSNPVGFSSNAINPTVYPTVNTTYIVAVWDGFNTVIDSVAVAAYSLPVASASNTGPYCQGETIQLNASGGTNYQWTGPGGYGTTTEDPSISAAIIGNSGNYTVTVTNGNGCTSTATTTVTVNPLPLATASNGGPYCEGENIQLNSGGGLSYNWSGPASYANATQNPSIANATPAISGNYWVTVTGTGGCTSSATTTVVVNELPTVTASSNSPYCAGDSIVLLAGGGSDYVWSGPGSFSSNSQSPIIAPAQITQSGTYYVTATDVNGCSNSAQTTILVNASPSVSISGADTICEGKTITLTASGAGSYEWNTGSVSATISATAISSATYIVTGSIGSCTDIDSIEVIVHPSPVADAGPDTIVSPGDAIQLNGSGGVSYLWIPSDYLSDPNVSNPTCTPEDSITYILIVTNEFGCTNTDTIVVRLDAECGSIYVPNAFSPNGDGKNDVFGVFNRCLIGIDLKVFNQWGNLVFETTDPTARWDGTFGGHDAESGIYSFYYKGTLSDETPVEGQGNFVLIR